jgi:hypothetical protein
MYMDSVTSDKITGLEYSSRLMRDDLQLESSVLDSCSDASSSDLLARLSTLPPSIIAARSYLVALQARTCIHLTPVKLSLLALLPMHFVLLIPRFFLSLICDSCITALPVAQTARRRMIGSLIRSDRGQIRNVIPEFSWIH